MEGFKLTFTLGSEIIPTPFATLDSILGYLAFTATGDPDIGEKLPLEKIERPGGLWFYAASSWKPDGGMVAGMQTLYKTQPLSRWISAYHGDAKINEASGPHRSYSLSFQTLAVPAVVFTGKGDMDQVAELAEIAKSTGLFKKAAAGFGKVIGVKIEPHEWSLYQDGLPVRPVPWDGVSKDGMTLARHSIVPPYWRSPEMACEMPRRIYS